MKRVIADDGLFIAPTFCAGENPKSRIIASLVGFLSGFKVISQWNMADYKDFMEKNGFFIENEVQIGGTVPLSYLILKKN